MRTIRADVAIGAVVAMALGLTGWGLAGCQDRDCPGACEKSFKCFTDSMGGTLTDDQKASLLKEQDQCVTTCEEVANSLYDTRCIISAACNKLASCVHSPNDTPTPTAASGGTGVSTGGDGGT